MLTRTLRPILLLLAGVALLLTSLPPAFGAPAPCIVDSLRHYLGVPCTIEDKEFRFGFYESSIDPALVMVTPLATPGNPGVLLSSPEWNHFGPFSNVTELAYRVTVLPGGNPIDDAALMIGVNEDTLAAVDEFVCFEEVIGA